MTNNRQPLGETGKDAYALPIDTQPMEAKSASSLPADGGWQYEPKWDGFRCLVFKQASHVDLRAKSGKSLRRYFPEVASFFEEVDSDDFVVDGELTIEIDGRLDFEALQMRLHPAESRIRRLATETPARFVLFDILATPGGRSVIEQPLMERRQLLEQFAEPLGSSGKVRLSPVSMSVETAKRWLEESGPNGTDGVVAKRLDGAYQCGERAMIKVKRLRTADCVVGGFRYESNGNLVGSLLLGLFNASGELDHVGFTSTISDDERSHLTARLESLREAPGFTGKAPGGPSRWSTERSGAWEPVKPQLVVEVRFDHVTGQRFRHGTKLMRWRPDKRPDQCTYDQIA
jgi:ATP-dependent DNA ligase